MIAINGSQTNVARQDDPELTELLARTSRTFALAIPCLPFPACREVTVAYLLFRVADTIEDSPRLNRSEKLAAFESLESLLVERRAGARLEFPRPPSENAHYLALLDELPLVATAVDSLRAGVREAILESTKTLVQGMKRFVAAGNSDGSLHLHSVSELRDYCYVVAGVVGEMLTEVFTQGATWLEKVRPDLDAHARWFGEGLQLVNVLKDSAEDQDDGRQLIPASATRSELFELAREDLHKAEIYVATLKRAAAPPGFVAFTELPLALAWRTLECVEQFGPGSKVPRSEVMEILGRVLFADLPAVSAKRSCGVTAE